MKLEGYVGKQKNDLPTNNYHQLRLGVLLGCIEAIALGEKLTHFKGDFKSWLDVGGSAMAVGSIVLDAYYSVAKSIREIEQYRNIKAIDDAADVVRGGFKLGAGVLGGLAGLCGAILDYMKWKKEEDTTLVWIYGLRSATGFVSAGLTVAAAYSYAGPMLGRVAQGHATNVVRYRVLTLLSSGAGVLAKRVRLLVWVARWSWAGLAITAVEVGYLSLKDDDLQNWCEKSVFRKVKNYDNWLGREVATERFEGASREIEMLERASRAVRGGG